MQLTYRLCGDTSPHPLSRYSCGGACRDKGQTYRTRGLVTYQHAQCSSELSVCVRIVDSAICMGSPAHSSPQRAASKPLVSNSRHKPLHSFNPLKKCCPQKHLWVHLGHQAGAGLPGLDLEPPKCFDLEQVRPIEWCGHAFIERKNSRDMPQRPEVPLCKQLPATGRHIKAHRDGRGKGKHRQPAVLQ